MIFPAQELRSKHDRRITIRTLRNNEAQALIDLKLSYLATSNTIPLNPHEYQNSVEQEAAMIDQYNTSTDSILLAAFYQENMIGNIDITVNTRERLAHTAMLGMGINTSWQNQGIGQILMQSSIDWCAHHSSLELIWLDVYASNTIALKLYEKLQFKIAGRIPKFFKHEDQYFDKIQMYRTLK